MLIMFATAAPAPVEPFAAVEIENVNAVLGGRGRSENHGVESRRPSEAQTYQACR